MTDAELVEVLLPLVVDDPWAHSLEGLDDQCLFCEGWHTTQVTPDPRKPWDRRPVYHHAATCPWLVAMDALGRPHPMHVVHGG